MPSTDKRLHNIWSTLSGLNSAVRRNEAPAHATAWMNLENITVSKRSQSQKAVKCRIPLIWNVQKRQIQRQRVIVAARGWGRSEWQVTAHEDGVSLGRDGNVLELVVMAMQFRLC